ncbi:MAG TPA: SGNH/GDSL hydrolase family protein [Phnomibacter sp.]|nr:SGNH/GDSL hydrolase family protein [Phnomibacter sp.]
MSKHIHTILCLGDSYTIGEGVPLHQSFPYKTVQMLRKEGFGFHAPEVVAQTGWTSFELADHLIHQELEANYDFVTLLIGVNDQYRDREMEDFADDFEFLLKKAIGLCVAHEKQVFAISIPDWGVTPFAKGKNTGKIAEQIDSFNSTASLLAAKYNVAWLDITTDHRKVGHEPENLVADKLHPSATIHQAWAQLLKESIISRIR